MAKEVPWCTVFLCLSALLMHTLTFVGNMDTADSILAMGKSVDGWSDVGLATSTALAQELDALLSNVTYELTDAINRTIETQETIDNMLSMMSEMVSSMAPASGLLLLQTDMAAHDNPLSAALQPIMKAMQGLPLFQNSLEILQEMFETLKPTLLQVGVWIETFGDKVQATVETFGTTMDRVQKLFDQVMMQISGVSGENAEEMEHNTFNLFDTDGNGAVSVEDLQNLAQLYAINALDGAKAESLVSMYDTDSSNDVDTTEFSDLVQDQSITGIMATVLREYAKRLSMVAGNVGAARMRSELSANLVQYFQLVCSKNITKVGWISQMLSNGTLPLPFTADVLAELAFAKDDPNVLTVVDVGELVIGTMMNLDAAYTQTAVDLMTTPEHWDSEGFNPDDQAMAVEAVVGWTKTGPAVAKAVKEASLDLVQLDLHQKAARERELKAVRENEEHKLAAQAAGRLAAKRMKSFQKFKRAHRAAKRRSRFGDESQQLFLVELLHGVAMTDGPLDQAMAAIAQGVPAKPETLLFAQWLKANATDTADEFQEDCFTYTGQSSNALDAFNTQIQGMVKKISGFIDQMKAYATPAGIDKLETIVEEYATKALTDIMNAVKKMVLKVVMDVLDQMETAKNATKDAVSAGLTGGDSSLLEWNANSRRHGLVVKNASRLSTPKVTSVGLSGFQAPLHDTSMQRERAANMLRELQDPKAAAADAANQAVDFVNGVWEQVSTMLRTVLSITPTALDTLKTARKEVSAVSETLDSLFTTLKESGPPIFQQVSTLWTMLWVLYFFFVMPLSMGILYYGFWASGWFGGPAVVTKKEDLALLDAPEGGGSVDEPPPQPSGFFARCCSCFGGCCDCLRSCHDTQLCFWSFIIIFQFIVLLLFIVSIVFVLLAGVQIFIGTGCAQIYLLGDVKVCTDTLGMMSEFLNTFIVGDGQTPLTMTCDHYHLRTCSLIKERLVNSAIFTVVGSFTASILSFQLIFASAQLHERARYNRIKAEKGIPVGDGM